MLFFPWPSCLRKPWGLASMPRSTNMAAHSLVKLVDDVEESQGPGVVGLVELEIERLYTVGSQTTLTYRRTFNDCPSLAGNGGPVTPRRIGRH
jgi:hypothetical protein